MIEKPEKNYEELLKEYNEQSKENELSHAYSEFFHQDYSDSSCCC